MGGCRCSYRKCTVVTDGKTHFFHYPVLDKDRCHNWLINARRLDFINLTKNQLKNRVICQNHFLLKMFMNYKCDRLVYHAVPTEDGPSPPETEEENKEFLNLASTFSKKLWVFMENDNVSINQTDPVNKEDSVLIVNDSPITGYSFTEPDNKKVKVAEPYIEFLTRKQVGLIDMAKRRLIEKSNDESTKVSKVVKKVNESSPIVSEIKNIESVLPAKINNIVVPLTQSQSVKKTSPKKVESNTSIEINVISDKRITQPISIPSTTTITPVRKVVPSFVIQKRLTQNDITLEKFKPPSKNMVIKEKTNGVSSGNVTFNNEVSAASEYIEIIFPDQLSKSNGSNDCQKTMNSDIIKTNSLSVPRLVRSNPVTNSIPTQDAMCKDENVIEANVTQEPLKDVQVKDVENVISSTLLKKIDDNTREIAELRRLLLQGNEEKVATKRKKEEDHYDEEAVKLRLYKEISAFISPNLIKLVHDELFPSVIRFSDESPKKQRVKKK